MSLEPRKGTWRCPWSRDRMHSFSASSDLLIPRGPPLPGHQPTWWVGGGGHGTWGAWGTGLPGGGEIDGGLDAGQLLDVGLLTSCLVGCDTKSCHQKTPTAHSRHFPSFLISPLFVAIKKGLLPCHTSGGKGR